MKLILVSFLILYTGCANPEKDESRNAQKPGFLLLSTNELDLEVSKNFPERLAGRLEIYLDSEVVRLQRSRNRREALSQVKWHIKRLKNDGHKKIYLLAFKSGTQEACTLLPFLEKNISGFIGIEMRNNLALSGVTCLEGLRRRGRLSVLDIYSKRTDYAFRESNIRSQFISDNYEQRAAFGAKDKYKTGEERIFKTIRRWVMRSN